MNMINQNALTGFSKSIKNAPKAVPMKAPTIGITVVKPTKTETTGAKGISKISIPINVRHPKITASVN